MTLNKIACIAGMLLLACGAYAAEDSDVSSSIDPIGFRCMEDSPTYLCYIIQVDAAAAVDMNFYTFGTSWNEFVTRFNNFLSSVSIPKGTREMEVRFLSDIHLEGKKVKNGGGTECVGAQPALSMNLPFATLSVHVSGQNRTIYDYCSIKTGSAGFFKKMRNALVEDLSFSGAYVESQYDSQDEDGVCAGVFADSAFGVEFSNVTVKNSTVASFDCSGGIVGTLSGDGTTGYAYSSKIHDANVDVKVSGPIAGGLAAVLNNVRLQTGKVFDISNNTVNFVVDDEIVDSAVYVGGLIGLISIPTDDNDIKFSKNTVKLDVKENGESTVSPPEDYSVGGLAGSIILNSRLKLYDNKVTSAAMSVKRKVDGNVYIGGEVGRVQISGFARTDIAPLINASGEIVNTTIQVSSKGNEYLGGIVGNVTWADQGDIEFAQNQVQADIESENGNALTVNGGGLIGSVTEGGPGSGNTGMLLSSVKDQVGFSLLAASEEDVVAGGLFGYVSLKELSPTDPKASYGLLIDSSIVKAVDGKALVKTTSTVNAHVYVGGAIGEFAGPSSLIEMKRIRTQGNISIAANSLSTAPDAEAGVGGIAGKVQTRKNSQIYGNASEGDVSALIGKPGFIIGILHLVQDESFVRVFANYHYGNDDAVARDALGRFYTGTTPNEVTDWKENISSYVDYSYIVSGNFRNALDDLDAEGRLKRFGSGAIVMDNGDSISSGIIPADEMKSRLFTYVMNSVSNYVTWDNDSGELPVVSNKQTAYKVSINMKDIYDMLSNDEKSSIGEYLAWESFIPYVIAYTEKDGKLPKEFLDKMNNLSVDFVAVYKNSPFPLDALVTADVRSDAKWNRKFAIAYEADAGGSDVPIDDVSPIFLWPRVTSGWLYGAKGVLPEVLVKQGSSWLLYSPEEYRVPCKVTTCTEIHGTNMAGLYSFEQLFSQVSRDNTQPLTVDHADSIYIKYVYKGEVPATISVVDGSPINLVATSYGRDKNGKFVAVDSSKDESGYTKSDMMLTSRIGMRAGTGYRLKSWQADVWIAKDSWGASVNGFEACYENSYSYDPSSCYKNKSMNTEGPYLASPDSLSYYFAQEAKDENALKWTVKQLKPSEMLDMDSALVAFVPSEFNSTIFHVHVIPDYEEIPYKVSFYLNTKASDLFFTDGFDGQTFSVATNRDLPKVLRTDACFVGWSASPVKGVPDGSIYIDESFADSLIYYAKPLKDSLALYAAWAPDGDPLCYSLATMELNLIEPADKNSKSHGTLYLWQAYAEPGAEKVVYKHYFENGKMLVPAPGPYYATFHVSALPDKDYVLDSLWLNTVDNIGNPPQKVVVIPSANSDSAFTILLEGIFEYSLEPKFCKYTSVAYDLNSDRKSVFYGVQSLIDNAVMVKDNAGWLSLPRWIYTDDACVLGWAVKPDADTLDFYDYATNQAIIQALSDGKTLYAVWGDAEQCVNDAYYKKARLVAKNGTIEFDEFLYEGFKDSADYRTHKFVGDSIMLLPDFSGSSVFVLRAVEQSGFALDSVVAVYEGLNGEKLQKTLMAGDTLSDSLFNAVFTAYFSEGSAQPFRFVRSEFSQSGSAIRLVLETDAASARRSASLEMALTDALGNLVEKDTLAKKLSKPYNDTIVKCPLHPGVYHLNARLYAKSDTVKFDTSFTVSDEIVVAPNEWRMVSLASVEMDKVVWDDDPVFYWWDESSLGGEFWQYSSLKDSKKVDHEVGYWYNSLEGRPLKLNAKNETPSGEVFWRLDSVYSGWNLVANPYGWSIDIYGNGHGGQDEVEFWRYDSKTGGYEPATEIDPYEGVWAKAHFPMDWHAPAAPAFKNPHKDEQEKGKAAHKFALAKANGQNDWTIQAKLTDGNGKADVWNVLGAGKKAVSTEEPPEGMGDHVNLSIVDGKTFLAKSVRVGKPEMEWTLELSASSNRTGYLSFDGLNALREYGLKVFVTVDGKTTEMLEGEPLKVGLAKAGKRATVRVAESAPVVLAYELGGVRVLQAGRGLQVSFDASNGLAGKTARVDLVDLKGHVVSAATGKALVGANTVAVEAPLSGLYVVRVRLGGKQSTAKVLVR